MSADQTPVDVEAIRAELAAMAGRPWTAEAAEYFIGRLLDENARLNAENERIRAMTKLHRESVARQRHKLEQKLIGWREAAEEARAELDKAIREAAADKARIAAVRRVAEQPDRDWQRLSERMPQYFKPVDAEERARRTGWKQGASLFRDQLWAALGEVRPAEPAPEMPRPPAEEADALAKHEAAIAEYVRACKADGCSCYPIASNTKVISHWCRIHGVLSIVPAELTWTNPGIRGGEPCMRGTRVPVEEVAGYLADGATWDEIREMLPSLPSLPVPSTEEARDER